MSKIILVLCLVSAVFGEERTQGDIVKAAVKPLVTKKNAYLTYDDVDSSNITNHIESYILYTRHQFKHDIGDYEVRLEKLKQRHLKTLNSVNFQSAYVSREIVENEEYTRTLEVLDDLNRNCIGRFRPSYPKYNAVENEFIQCFKKAQSELSHIFDKAVAIKSELENYYKNTFEQEINECRSSVGCVVVVCTEMRNYASTNKKRFELELDLAECSAKANIKKAVSCSYEVHTRTVATFVSARERIRNCISFSCVPCCDVQMEVFPDINNPTMLNPFMESNYQANCVVLIKKTHLKTVI